MKAPSNQPRAPSQSDFPLSSEIDRAFKTALDRRIFSGASLLLGTSEKILHQQCWGLTKSDGIPIDTGTRFDLASLTKPLVTTILCMQAINAGQLGLDNCLASFFPAGFTPPDKRSITVRQLLNHCSGLPAYLPFYLKLIEVPSSERRAQVLQWIMQTELHSPPGERSIYSDLGFLALGMILEAVLDDRLDRLSHQLIFAPLAIDELEFVCLNPSSNPTFTPNILHKLEFPIAATEWCRWRQRLLQGEVHDENAYCLDGVAPHAGLFGTARGVYSLLSCLWRAYLRKSREVLLPSDLLETFWARQNLAEGSSWALGFDTPNKEGSSAGRYFSCNTVGHLGFTGTSLWMDLEQEIVIVLLTNRVYPTRDNEKIKGFRPFIHDLAMKAFYEFSKE
ncbi:MAG: serine hydrolase domain-containing protein [Desulfoferrobacter sp.]